MGLKGDFVKVRFLGLGIGEDLGLELAIQMAEIFHIVFIIGLVNNRGVACWLGAWASVSWSS